MKINLFNDEKFSGCYDADLEQWDLYILEKDIKELPVVVELSQDSESWWNCYLVKAQYMRKQRQYHLIYKDF